MSAVTERAQLVTTGEAAKALGINPTTLQRWAHAGVVTPAWRTAGGHMRWNLEDLQRQAQSAWQRDREQGDADPPFAPGLADAPRHPEEPR